MSNSDSISLGRRWRGLALQAVPEDKEENHARQSENGAKKLLIGQPQHMGWVVVSSEVLDDEAEDPINDEIDGQGKAGIGMPVFPEEQHYPADGHQADKTVDLSRMDGVRPVRIEGDIAESTKMIEVGGASRGWESRVPRDAAKGHSPGDVGGSAVAAPV